jgi:Ser/Thr protein kinase RdoA (MazF antagonist)
MTDTLETLGGQEAALGEAKKLRGYFSGLPRRKENFGLIHYDFEMDNVFYDETSRSIHVIDFDDVMQHWYMMDIVQALDSLEREVSSKTASDPSTTFLAGYQSHFAIEEAIWAALPVFRRFGDLYRYTRITRALQETWDHEPDWMVMLRKKLQPRLAKYAAVFGKELSWKGEEF